MSAHAVVRAAFNPCCGINGAAVGCIRNSALQQYRLQEWWRHLTHLMQVPVYFQICRSRVFIWVLSHWARPPFGVLHVRKQFSNSAFH